MSVIMTDEPDHVTVVAPRTTFVVHIKRPGASVSDNALCGDRWGAFVEAASDEAVPYIIGNVETLCVECKDRQFGDYDDPLRPVGGKNIQK